MSDVDLPAVVPPLRLLSLCAGIGGLDLALDLAFGARAVAYVENEAAACAVLVARMRDGALPPAPLWSDLRTFDGRPFRGAVDCVAAGFPCVDVALVNRNASDADGRRSALWREVVRVYAECGAPLLVLENAASLPRRGLDRILDALAALGCDAAWGLYGAEETTGLPHRRRRCFLFAARRPLDDARRLLQGERLARRVPGAGDAAHAGDPLASGGGVDGAPLLPPGPDDLDGWRAVDPAFLPALRLQPGLRGVADGPASWLDGGLGRLARLGLVGNAVAPPAGAVALRDLARALLDG
jgi:DNA (cytosine-5)-methyltransferase 1